MISRLLFLSGLLFASHLAAAEPPKPIDDRLAVELVAQEPALRTPTAIAVDAKGRVWVLENNTHFRPKNYSAPPTDRVLVMDDFDPAGQAQRVAVFADGFRDGMGMRLLPDGSAIVSTRAETFLLRDTHSTGKADERITLLQLETKNNYPHNGLSGIALDGKGHLFVGLGENHGFAWKLTGSDGASVSGADEGGIFRCDLNGANLERWAVGLWNPFGLTVDAAGRLFALDNDPGAGSLCRLLHIVRGGDYGYRMRYGRTIDHPFLSWFGTIPGTLPPVCLVGEAPTGIIEYRGTGLPAELRGQLLGCTWSDHGIQRLPLQPRGASFSCQPGWLVHGGEEFHPTGIAEAPDGSLLIADWADHSYEVHGKGRIWRVRAKQPAAGTPAPPSDKLSPDEDRMQALLSSPHGKGPDGPAAWAALRENDPYIFHGAIEALARDESAKALVSHASDPQPRVRLGTLLALRRAHAGTDVMPRWLADPDGSVRRAALQWIAEEHVTDQKLEAVLAPPLSRATFEAYLATVQMLVAGKPDASATIAQTREIALDSSRPAALRALAVRLLPVESKGLSLDQIQQLLADPDAGVQLAAAQILAARTDDASQEALRRLAADIRAGVALRTEAVAGLTASVASAETRAILHTAMEHPLAALRTDALRTVRGHVTPEEFAGMLKIAGGGGPESRELLEELLMETRANARLQTFASRPEFASVATPPPPPGKPWPAVTDGTGDPAAGRRIFYHPNGPGCATCHTIEGRGGKVGPDLTRLDQFTPEKLLEAIREPSKEIAPAFSQWLLKLKDGREVNGIDAFEDNKEATTLIDASGKRTKYKNAEIVTREALPVSLMPPGLELRMTEQELRDLIAYLRQPRE